MSIVSLFRNVLVVGTALLFAGCAAFTTPNQPLRGGPVETPADLEVPIKLVDCASEDCSKAIIERHENYDLAFLEFSERGNIFNREAMEAALEHIETLANGDGVQVILFIHGWKHNAGNEDSNVRSFRRSLDVISSNPDTGNRNRRTVGVYIGWRGLSLDVPGIVNATFWDRKAVAEEVGKGGVTEVLLKLHHITGKTFTNTAEEKSKNIYMIVGHSFGGAVVLSALKDVLLQSMVSARFPKIDNGMTCHPAKPIADGVILLNPAIEANQAVQIKEVEADCQYPRDQIKLLHVISTDADSATSFAFPIGEWLGVSLTWKENDIPRISPHTNESFMLEEKQLDIQTVGNLEQFRTGYLSYDDHGNWNYEFCPGDVENSPTYCNIPPEKQANHIRSKVFDPLVFVKTDRGFMEGHNDVFNCNVHGYLTAITYSTLYSRSGRDSSVIPDFSHEACLNGDRFDFGGCFAHYRGLMRTPGEKLGEEGTNQTCHIFD